MARGRGLLDEEGRAERGEKEWIGMYIVYYSLLQFEDFTPVALDWSASTSFSGCGMSGY